MIEITEVKPLTFADIVSQMVKLREEGDSSIIKRENFRDYPQISKAINFGIAAFPFASFGYIERLIRKLSAEYSEMKFSKLTVQKYREACGFFSGELELVGRIEDNEMADRIKFSWSGKGEIEKTWDNFVEWQKESIQINK